MDTMDYEFLLKEYKEIWNNRRLESEENPEKTLLDAITRELKDENTHPRARRTLMEKYFLATKRIIESAISNESKVLLIKMHSELTERLKKD
jgi:hypothetical protein